MKQIQAVEICIYVRRTAADRAINLAHIFTNDDGWTDGRMIALRLRSFPSLVHGYSPGASHLPKKKINRVRADEERFFLRGAFGAICSPELSRDLALSCFTTCHNYVDYLGLICPAG